MLTMGPSVQKTAVGEKREGEREQERVSERKEREVLSPYSLLLSLFHPPLLLLIFILSPPRSSVLQLVCPDLAASQAHPSWGCLAISLASYCAD